MTNISFSTKITEQDLFRFNIHHAYTSMQGIFSIIVSLLLIVVWGMRFDGLSPLYQILYPLVAILFCLYIPMTLKIRVKNQMTQDVFMHPLNYELKDKCITISSPSVDEPADLPWEYVYKVVRWKEYLLIYSNRVNAYIIPVEDIENQYDSIVTFIKSHVEDYKITIK